MGPGAVRAGSPRMERLEWHGRDSCGLCVPVPTLLVLRQPPNAHLDVSSFYMRPRLLALCSFSYSTQPWRKAAAKWICARGAATFGRTCASEAGRSDSGKRGPKAFRLQLQVTVSGMIKPNDRIPQAWLRNGFSQAK